MNKERAKEVTNFITTNVGGSTDNVELIVEAMNYEHRTHQQDFTRLCVAWLQNCGSVGYSTDLRNKASKDVGEHFVKSFALYGGGPYLPRV